MQLNISKVKLLGRNNYLKTGLIFFLLSILLNGFILETIGPNIVPDSSGYVRVANNYNEHGSLMENDYNGDLIAFTERMPLYPFILSYIINDESLTEDNLLPAAMLNVVLYALTVVIVFFSANALFGFKIGIIAGVFSLLDPWATLVTRMILPDTLFNFLISIVFFISCLIFSNIDRFSLKSNVAKYRWFLLLGVSIGFAALARPTANYYWLVIAIIVFSSFSVKEATQYFLVSLIGISLFTGTWALRNYVLDGNFQLQSISGVSLLWGTHTLTSPSTLDNYREDAILAGIRDDVVNSIDSVSVVVPIRKKYNLSVSDADKYLMKIAIENITNNPFKAFKIYTVNILKTMSTLFNTKNINHSLKSYPISVVLGEKVASFVIFVALLFVSIFVMIKQNSISNVMKIFLIINLLYFIGLSSLVLGGFRYRLPIHSLYWIVNAYTLFYLYTSLRHHFNKN